ncbi:MFS transporter [Pseudomonas paraversuta]|uniref:MFS transporter n=1 Tax=Pseudomonas paraversuta TaxID=2750624 RepID=UPI003D2923CD
MAIDQVSRPDPAAPATTGRRMLRALVGLFACASGLSVANVYYAQPLLDQLATDFAISHARVGAVITATQIGSVLALLLIVPLGDQLDRRRLMLAQLAVLIAGLVCVGLTRSPAMMLSGMLVIGLLGTAMTQGLIAYAATACLPQERGRVVGTVQGGVVIGLLLSRLAAGLISDLGGWRWVYLGSSLVMLALGLILWRVLPPQQPATAPIPYPRLVLSMFTLLRQDRVLQVRGMLALLMFAVLSIFWSALVFLLISPPYSFSHTTIGTFGLVGVVGALAAARAGAWADKGLGQWTTGLALGLLIMAWLALWFTSSSMLWLIVGVVLLDLGAQAIHVTNQSMIFSAHPDSHSRVVGCYMLFYATGSGLGALASTWVYATSGWSGVCLLGAAVSVLALGFWAGTLRQMPGSRACVEGTSAAPSN